MKKIFGAAILCIVLIVFGILGFSLLEEKEIERGESTTQKFSSMEELASFLEERQSESYGSGFAETSVSTGVMKASAGNTVVSETAADYSTTNIQVEGVDEADIVKSDGKYLYVVTGETISIVDAYPAENAKILSTIDVNGYPDEILINQDSLIVFGREKYQEPIPYEGGPIRAVSLTPVRPYFSEKSFIKVYTLKDRENPKLEDSITYDGNYYDSRMVGNKAYIILNQPVHYSFSQPSPRSVEQKPQIADPQIAEDGAVGGLKEVRSKDGIVQLPTIVHEGKTIDIMPQDIYYFDIYDYSYQLTTILALDLDNLGSIEKQSFLTGYTQNIFVSQENIYLTSQKQIPYQEYQNKIFEEAVLPLLDKETADQIRSVLHDDSLGVYERQEKILNIYEPYFNKLSQDEKENFIQESKERGQDVEAEIAKETEKTIVHKISIKDGIEYKMRGEVPGHVLNQFSMDEYNGNFRIATTTGEVWSGNSRNHIYVLDENLKLLGKIEDLAEGEKIYSVRFMGERAYLVTFKKVDPLFVVDLSNPENPKVLGELKIPGYSDYLHPYDENHIIGIGKEAVDATNEESFGRDFAWYQGIKIALFDVSDPENPKEVSKFNIGDRGTDSEALYEHKAFLFDREKELLVLPISLHEINKEQYSGEIPPTAYGELTFEGAYVFSLNLEEGFVLKGRITHADGEQSYSYGSQIRRSLYIDDVLYTISQRKIEMHALGDLSEINAVLLPFKEPEWEIYPRL